MSFPLQATSFHSNADPLNYHDTGFLLRADTQLYRGFCQLSDQSYWTRELSSFDWLLMQLL